MTPETALADLKEERAATISFFDAEILIALQSHLSRERGGDEVFCRPVAIAEKLSELYPAVSFGRGPGHTREYAPVVAEVKDGFEGTLREALGSAFLLPDDFEGTVHEDADGLRCVTPLGENGRAVFCPGGLGYIEEDDTQFFSHTLDLAALREEAGGDDNAIEDRLREYFDEHVNYTLNDPYISSSDLADQEIHFLSGSEEELERLVQLFVLTEPEIEEKAGEYVVIRTATDDEEASLAADSDSGYYTDRLNSLVELALESNEPEGWTYEYNDGAASQRSGFDLCPDSLSYNIEDILELPARVRMAARRDLKQWLEGRGRRIEEFDPEPFVAAENNALPTDDDCRNPNAGGCAGDDVLFPTVPLTFDPTPAPERRAE